MLIIKSAVGTVEQLVGAPQAWSGRKYFNNDDLDPGGLVLSGWLTAYIQTARSLYDGGNGVVGLQTFIELVEDPNWCGFLYLNVPVDVGHLDEAIEFLLAGIDRKAFIAHHVGCAVNHTVLRGGVYQPTSSYFGVVHYVRPGSTPGAATVQPSFVPSTADYDFQVLTLDAVFANSSIGDFKSAAQLVVNKLFGDAISPSSPDTDVPATNTLLIYGAMQQHDGVPHYAFATAKGVASTFFPVSAGFERIEIDSAFVQFGTDARGNDTARFQMSGWFALAPLDGFDLLSYGAISFDNLALVMTFPADGSGPASGYAFDASGLNSANLPLSIADAASHQTAATAAANTVCRLDSLAADFPVKPAGLVIGQAGKTPADMGYRTLTVAVPTGSGTLGDEWYAMELDLGLGGLGSLGSGSLLTAKFLLAWGAGGAGGVDFAPWFKLEGPGGINLTMEIEGVIKLGAAGIYLMRTTTTTGSCFLVELANIGITVLSVKFSAGGHDQRVPGGHCGCQHAFPGTLGPSRRLRRSGGELRPGGERAGGNLQGDGVEHPDLWELGPRAERARAARSSPPWSRRQRRTSVVIQEASRQQGVALLSSLCADLKQLTNATWHFDWIPGSLVQNAPRVTNFSELGFTQTGNSEGYAVLWQDGALATQGPASAGVDSLDYDASQPHYIDLVYNGYPLTFTSGPVPN